MVDNQALPKYELKAVNHGPDDFEMEIWQLPSTATPNIKQRTRIAGLRGRNFALIEHRIIKRLKVQDIEITGILPGTPVLWSLTEELALNLGLLFRVLAPMHSQANMRAVTEGVERMGKEEASYWLGMAMHRKYPRRVLSALRMLLIDPKDAA